MLAKQAAANAAAAAAAAVAGVSSSEADVIAATIAADPTSCALRAVGACFRSFAEMLVDCGGRVNMRSREGSTSLYTAAMQGDSSEVCWLLGEGAAVNLPVIDGASPLQAACAHRHANTAALLVGAGAKPQLALATGHCAGFPALHLLCASPLGAVRSAARNSRNHSPRARILPGTRHHLLST